MSYTEHAPCRFEVTPNADGKPAMLHVEFVSHVPSAFAKPSRRIFFGLSEKITWEEAEALAKQLNKSVRAIGITEYAAGE